MLQIYGTCENCQAGQPAARSPIPGGRGVRPRRASHGHRHRTERPGVLHARREARARSARARRVHAAGRRRGRTLRAARGALSRIWSRSVPDLEAQPTFLFFKGAANGLFAAGAEELDEEGHRRSQGASHRHSLRAWIAPVLQALWQIGSRSRKASACSSNSPTRNASTSICSSASTARSCRGSAAGSRCVPFGAGAPRDRSSSPHHGIRRTVHAGRARSRGRPRRASARWP